MQGSRSNPAAKVTRVSSVRRENKDDDPAADQLEEKGCDAIQSALPEDIMLPIIGDVKERGGEEDDGCVRMPAVAGGSGGDTGVAFPVAQHRSMSKFKLGRTKHETNKKSHVRMIAKDEDVSNTSDAMLAEMSPEEIEEAKREILSKLPGKTVEFLKKRHLDKKQMNEKDRGKVINKKEEEIEAHVVQKNAPIDAGKSTLSGKVSSLVERLRFDMDGKMDTSLANASNGYRTMAEDVLQRDPVRQSQGVVESSLYYSVLEACTLSQSSEFRQRVVGLKILGGVLQACRQGLGENGNDSIVPVSSELKRNISLEGLEHECPVTWLAIWRHATYSAEVAKVIRYCMDDSRAAIILEACAALVCCIEPCKMERDIMEASDNNPMVGWPKMPLQHVQRANKRSEWLSAPLNLLQQKENGIHSEEGLGEQDLARIDPVSGLLNMRLLERINHLFGRKDFAGHLLDLNLLKILYALSLSGRQAAEYIASIPDLRENFRLKLQKKEYGSEIDEEERLVLRIIRSLCQSSGKIVEAMMSSKILIHVRNKILCSRQGEDSGLAECFQIWRASMIYGFPVLAFDDAFPSIHGNLSPLLRNDTSLKPRVYTNMREAYLVAAQCCISGNISPACCLAVLKEAMVWVKSWRMGIEDSDGSMKSDKKILLNLIPSLLYFCVCCMKLDTLSQQDKDDACQFIKEGLFQQREDGSICLMFNLAQISCDLLPHSLSQTKTDLPAVASILICSLELSRALDLSGGWMQTLTQSIISVMYSYVFGCQGSVVTQSGSEVIQPWEGVQYQKYLHMGRLLSAVDFPSGQMGDTQVKCTSLICFVLSALAPGSEDVALPLLASVFRLEGNSIAETIGSLGMQDHTIEAILSEEFDSTDDNYNLHFMGAAISGISQANLGYRIEGFVANSSEAFIRKISTDQVYIVPEGSNLPLPPDWMFQKGHAPNSNKNLTYYRAMLLWILNAEGKGALNYLDGVKKTSGLLRMILSDSQHESEAHEQNRQVEPWKDSFVRKAVTLLINRYVASFSKTMFASQQPAEWSVTESKHFAECYAAESFGDKLFGTGIALALSNIPISNKEAKEEILSTLKDFQSLHLLPSLDECPGSRMLFLRPAGSSECLDPKLMLEIISTSEFMRCLEAASLVVDIAMHNILVWVFHLQDTEAKLCNLLRRLATHIKGSAAHTKALELSLKYILTWNVEKLCFDDSIGEDRLSIVGSLADDDERIQAIKIFIPDSA